MTTLGRRRKALSGREPVPHIFRHGGGFMEQFVNILSTVGFPAALCVIMLKYIVDQRDAHKAESESYRKAIDANTTAITALTTWLQAKEANKHV